MSKTKTNAMSGFQLQRFKFGVLHRSQVDLFSVNPRTIDRSAKRRLRESLKRNGLVEPLVVNLRTAEKGFLGDDIGSYVLISGHQRTSCADELFKYDPTGHGGDYEVPASIIEVNSAAEKALVIALNNPSLQGSFDSDLLERLITDPEIDIAATGFDRTELGMMFDQFIIDGIFGESAAEQAKLEIPVIEELEAIRQAGKAAAGGHVPSDSQGELHPTRISTTNYTATLADDARIAAERDIERERESVGNTPEDFLQTLGYTPTTQLGTDQTESARLAENERKRTERAKYIAKAAFDRDAAFMVTIVAETCEELIVWLDGLGLSLPESKMISLADIRDAIEEGFIT